jgi:hypothetical protein
VAAVVWHGNQQDALDLMNALARNCACETDAHGVRLSICAAHQMTEDQRVLDRLLFARYISARLRSQEWSG